MYFEDTCGSLLCSLLDHHHLPSAGMEHKVVKIARRQSAMNRTTSPPGRQPSSRRSKQTNKKLLKSPKTCIVGCREALDGRLGRFLEHRWNINCSLLGKALIMKVRLSSTKKKKQFFCALEFLSCLSLLPDFLQVMYCCLQAVIQLLSHHICV